MQHSVFADRNTSTYMDKIKAKMFFHVILKVIFFAENLKKLCKLLLSMFALSINILRRVVLCNG